MSSEEFELRELFVWFKYLMAPDFESLTLSFSISIFLLVDGYIFRKKSYRKHIWRYLGIYTPLLLSLCSDWNSDSQPRAHILTHTFLFWKEPEEELEEAFWGRRQHLRRHRTVKRCAIFYEAQVVQLRWLCPRRIKPQLPQLQSAW